LRIWALKAKALIDHLSEDIGGGITRIEAWAASAAQSIKYLIAGLAVMKGAKVIASFIQPMYAAHKFQSAINQVTTAQGALQASLIQTNTLLQTQNTLMAGGGVRRGTQTAAFGASPVGAATASATSRAAGVAGVAGAKAGLGALSMAALTPTGIGQVVGAAAMVGMIGLTAYEAYEAYRSIKGATEKDMDGLRRKQKEILDAMRPDEEAEAKKASAKARIGAHVQTSGDLEYLEKKRENVRKEIAQVQALMKDASGAQMEMLTNVYDGLLEQEKKLYNQISTMSLQFRKDADLTMATSKASIGMVQDDFLAALSSSYEGPRGAAEYLIETNGVINAQITQLRLKYAEATEGIAADQENLARMEKKAGEIRSKWFKSTYDKKELAQLERLISNVEKSLSSAQAKRAEEEKLGSETLSFTAAKVLAEEGVSVEELTKTWDELQAKMKSVREEGLDEETAKARANAMGAIEKYRHGLSLLYAEESKYIAAQEKLLELSVQGTQLRIDGANSEEKQRKLSGEMAVHMKKINALLKDNIPLRAEVRKIGIDSAKALAKDQEKLRLVEEEALKRLYAMKIAYQDKGISALNYVQAQKAELDALQELRDSQDKNLQAMKGINELYHSAPAGLNAYAQAMDNVSRAEAAGLVSAKQAAAYRQQSLNDMVAAANLPTAKGSLPNNFLSSTFNPLLSHVGGMGAYARDMAMSPLAEKAEQDELQRAYDLNKEKYEIIRLSNQDNLELQKYANEQEIAAKEKFESDKLSLEQSYADRSKAVAQQQRDYQVQSMMLIAAGMADTAAYVAGAMADSFEDGSRSQKAAFAMQKALAISSIMLNAYVAAQAAKTAMLSTAYMSGPAGLLSAETAYWLVLGQGIATAGMVGGMALAEITSSGKSGGKVGSRSAGMFDSGGTISRGKWGIVGEYGPEIVNGPARVTSRKNTAHQLGSGATIAPVINVNYTSSGDSETSQKDAAIMAEMVKSIVVKTLNDEMRSNGMMSR
jgi:hypothetical protein